MTKDQITALATYLGGGQQAKFSIYLSLGGMKADDAHAFFKLRDAFGVQSYASVEDAATQIAASLKQKKR